MEDEIKLNDGHIHEAIDRISVAINYIQSSLAEHALIESVAEFDKEVQKSMEILADLYQKIGVFETITEIADVHKLKQSHKVD